MDNEMDSAMEKLEEIESMINEIKLSLDDTKISLNKTRYIVQENIESCHRIADKYEEMEEMEEMARGMQA